MSHRVPTCGKCGADLEPDRIKEGEVMTWLQRGAEVAKRGVQVIGTRVDDGALRVEADGASAGEVVGGKSE